MYPDWPDSDADLVPLPQCDGPKLRPFDFHGGPQSIKFLQYLGRGAHAHVFKVEILNQIYALKVFKFLPDDSWLTIIQETRDFEDRDAIAPPYNYSEPFSCECRAFGRLQEAGYEELAATCFGYILLDEGHEAVMRDKFKNRLKDIDGIHFTRDFGYTSPNEQEEPRNARERFLGKNDRKPPFRCIVKEYGERTTDMRPQDFRKILRNIEKLQQLGIINLDMALRQIFNGKLSDLSVTMTTPHYLINPELNPELTERQKVHMEFNTFGICVRDYAAFNFMVDEWNERIADRRKHCRVYAFSTCRKYGLQRYDLRMNIPSRRGVFTPADPRKYNWRASLSSGTVGVVPSGTRRRRVTVRPSGWHYNGPERAVKPLRNATFRGFIPTLEWEVENHTIFPKIVTWSR
ncbi:uncharacterized protein DNG_09922 [Cephalotrichum gorgonifer]|uniref:Protein kinase domain-containing protein n=1 Tax=Cephalotrichum gorgonifer TaxID=2041049 RepID=A0AAE8SZV6_9PEZI|nr:uncharacterized protein DNG_09922 [Cephalotrichum gorgonifer]